MESALDASNRGFRLLQKMGWKQGVGLGKHEQGIVEPIKMKENLVCLGLGKAEEYDAMTEQATKERRKLDAEIVETQQETQLRLERAAKEDQIKVDVKAIQAAFFCQDCQKQYKTVKEMENHLSSYDHHHRKRLQELKKQSVTAEEQNSKRKREQQHEAAMLQKRIELAAVAAVATSASTAAAAAAKPSVEPGGKPAQATTKIGFSFGGKAGKPGAFMSKKPQKKVVTNPIASAFANPFEQQQEERREKKERQQRKMATSTAAAAAATPVRGWASAAAAARTNREGERAPSMAPRVRSAQAQQQQRMAVGLRPVTQQQLEARHFRRAASAPVREDEKAGIPATELPRVSATSGDDVVDDDDDGEWKSVESKSRWNRAHKRVSAATAASKRTSTAVVPTPHVPSSSYYSWATTSVTSASSAVATPRASKSSVVQREDSLRRQYHIRQDTSSSTTTTSVRHESTSSRISTTLQEDSLRRNTNSRGRKTEQNGAQSRSGVRSPPAVVPTSGSAIQRCTSLQQLLNKIELDKQDVEQQQSTSTRRRSDQSVDHERRSSIEPVKPPPPPAMKCGDKRDFFFRNLDFETRNRLQIDDVAGFSVTEHEMATKISEAILALYAANEPASLSASSPPDQQDVREKSPLTITDATACVGGNVISFCDYFSIVNAVECDLTRCEMLQHNLAVLKKDNAICIHASYLMVMHDLQQDVAFIDPPWGGPEYKDLAKVDLFLDDIPLYDICKMLHGRAKIVVLKVPTNFDAEKFAEHVPGKVTVRKDLNKMHLVAIDFRDEKSDHGGK